MAKLYFRYAAMGAGKSLDLLKVAYNYSERDMRTMIFNSALDNRIDTGCISSRTGITQKCNTFTKDTKFLDIITKDISSTTSKLDCVLIDESQFLTKDQVMDLVLCTIKFDIPVICYGLRTDFIGNLFEGSQALLAWADTIEEMKTICWCGNKATMNARIINGNVVTSGEQIQIGGNESYIALCKKHFIQKNTCHDDSYFTV